MASLFSFASTAVAAVKGAVVGVISSESAVPVPVQQHSSKRPTTKGGAKQKKKLASKKKPIPGKNKSASANETDSDSDAEVEDRTTAPVVEESRNSPAAKPEVLGGESGAQEASDFEASNSDDEGSASASAGASSAAALEAARKEKARKKNEQKKLKQKQKKALMANSIVNNLPEDALEPERARILAEASAALENLPNLDPATSSADVKMLVPDLERSLQELIHSIDLKQKELTRKLPRCSTSSREKDIPALKSEVKKLEFSQDREDLKLAAKVEDLQALISAQNHKVFCEKANKIKTDAEDRLRAISALLRKANERETRERVARRMNAGKDDAEAIDPDSLTSRKMDITNAMGNILFAPRSPYRAKIEKKFDCIIDNPRGATGGQRSITIWGTDDAPTECFQFLVAAADNGLQKKTYERRFFGTIIGRSGANIAKIEQGCDAVVSVEGEHEVEVAVYGSRQGVTDVFTEIQEIIAAASSSGNTNPELNATIPLDPLVARALASLHRARLQKMETEFKARVRVMSNPNDNNPRIALNAPSDQMEALKAKVQSEIVDKFCVLRFVGPARAITRLMFPPRQANALATSRLLHDEFRALRDSLSLFVDRGARTDNADADVPVDMFIVCHEVDRANVETKTTELIEKASYTVSRVPVEREQLRIFTPETRALIEASSQCRLGVANAATGPGLTLTGSDSAVAKAKQVIAEVLEREGKVVKYRFEEREVIQQLFRDRAARLRELESHHGVAISISREDNEATIVGDQAAIDQCISQLEDMKRNTETLIITLDSVRIPQLIGREGARIREIRESSGVDEIHIPRRTDSSDDQPSTTDVSITGSKEAVEEARRMIERALNLGKARERELAGTAPSDAPLTGDSVPAAISHPYLGRGRGRQPASGQGAGPRQPPRTMPNMPRKLRPGPLADDEDFPTIASSISATATTHIVASPPAELSVPVAADETALTKTVEPESVVPPKDEEIPSDDNQKKTNEDAELLACAFDE